MHILLMNISTAEYFQQQYTQWISYGKTELILIKQEFRIHVSKANQQEGIHSKGSNLDQLS